MSTQEKRLITTILHLFVGIVISYKCLIYYITMCIMKARLCEEEFIRIIFIANIDSSNGMSESYSIPNGPKTKE